MSRYLVERTALLRTRHQHARNHCFALCLGIANAHTIWYVFLRIEWSGGRGDMTRKKESKNFAWLNNSFVRISNSNLKVNLKIF